MKKKKISTEESRTVPIQLRVTPSDKLALQKLAFELSRPGAMESVAGLAYKILREYILNHKK